MSGESGVRLQLSANLAVLTRANVIGHIARDIAAAAGVPHSKQETILDGIRKQLLREVEIVLYDRHDARVGYVAITVDWEKHRIILARGSARESFAINANESIAAQVAPLLDKVISYIAAASKQLGVSRAMVGYHGNSAKQAEYRAHFGGQFSAKELDDFRQARHGHELQVTDENVPEMSVVFRHLKL